MLGLSFVQSQHEPSGQDKLSIGHCNRLWDVLSAPPSSAVPVPSRMVDSFGCLR